MISSSKPRRGWIIGGLLVLAGAILAVGGLWTGRGKNSPGMGASDRPGGNSATTSVDANAPVLRPGEGIGDVPFGANLETVIDAFGHPSVLKSGNGFDTLEYPDRGFWLLCHDRTGLLQFNGFNAMRARVMNGSVSYAGKTVQGVGIGSSKDDVRRAFGEPQNISQEDTSESDISQEDTSESWSYKQPRISFEFDGDQVVGIGMTWTGFRKPGTET